MPNARIHHNTAKIVSIPLFILSSTILPLEFAILGVLTFLWADTYFSPDLDIESYARNNWRYLYFLWIPYYKIIPHRSILSHSGPFSTTIRYVYFLIITAPLLIPIGYAIRSCEVLYDWRIYAILWLYSMFADTLHVLLDVIFSIRVRNIKKWLRSI